MQQTLPLTEQTNPDSVGLDDLSVRAAVQLMNREDQKVVAAVAQAEVEIAATVQAIIEAFESGGRLIYLGAGTSGRLGVLDASECPPTFGTAPEQVQGIIAGGLSALHQAAEGAEDVEAQAETDLAHLEPEDVLVGIAASGSTPYVRSGLRFAKAKGCATALVTCNPVPQDDAAIDHYIVLEVGPEVLTGSTRLKAGTATKMVLNMLTTLSMAHTGKVYDQYMVDLKVSNQKLQQRALRMVQELSAVSPERAQQLLDLCDGEVKTALYVQKRWPEKEITSAEVAAARTHLQQHRGKLRVALEAADGHA